MPTGDDQGRVESEIQEILARSATDGAAAAPQGAREPLDRELRNIKETVVRMGSMAEAAIRDALDALVTHDAEKATAVIIGDRKINDMQHEVITAITTTIATQSPVARDLRNLLMMNHVVRIVAGSLFVTWRDVIATIAPNKVLMSYSRRAVFLELPESTPVDSQESFAIRELCPALSELLHKPSCLPQFVPKKEQMASISLRP
jgi:hypothetical protein